MHSYLVISQPHCVNENYELENEGVFDTGIFLWEEYVLNLDNSSKSWVSPAELYRDTYLYLNYLYSKKWFGISNTCI